MPQPEHLVSIDGSEPQTELIDLLLVDIGGQKVFIRSSEIKKVLRAKALTAVPMGPQHLKGLLNVYGQIVCIIDAGGVSSVSHCYENITQNTRFLLLRHPEMHVGIWVDEVHKIQHVDASVLAKMDDNDDSAYAVEIEGVVYDLLQCAKFLHWEGE